MGYVTARLLAALLCAHFISTAVFPPAGGQERKSAFSPGQFLGRGVLAGLLSYVLVGDWLLWQIPVVVFVVHVGVGYVLSKDRRSSVRHIARYHVLPLVVVGALAFALARLGDVDFFWGTVFGAHVFSVYAFVAGLLATVCMGANVVELAVQPFLKEIEQHHADQKEGAAEPDRGLARGGRTIGQLERLLIFLFVITGNPGGVGFLVAAKSIFRFGEVREQENRMEAEYILIGTLMSVGLALALSYATRFFLAALWSFSSPATLESLTLARVM